MLCKFEVFCENDIAELTPVMKSAFDHDTYIHTGEKEGGPTGYDNGNLFRKYYLDKGHISYKIFWGDMPAGGLCVKINDNKINVLESIFIDPKLQGKNIGKAAWDFIEQTFPDTVKWQVCTPAYSTRNIHFYVSKCGFEIVEKDKCGVCFMEKIRLSSLTLSVKHPSLDG